MGFLSNLFFGTNSTPVKKDTNGDAALPKQVKDWNLNAPTPSQATSATAQPEEEQSSTPTPQAPAKPRKIIPELECTNVDPEVSSDGKMLELWLTLRNRTSSEIEIRNIMILNQNYGMNQFYKPDEGREIKVFQGLTPLDYHATKATVQMKVVENDDYFEADFVVEFRQESYDGRTVWLPEELKPVRPIRDI